MAKLFITLASISGMLAVVLGAFGAHALKGKMDGYALGVFETATQYHFYKAADGYSFSASWFSPAVSIC
jgi:uncharacterized membrane protein YgdD (TMEM256/DUF423 family)